MSGVELEISRKDRTLSALASDGGRMWVIAADGRDLSGPVDACLVLHMKGGEVEVSAASNMEAVSLTMRVSEMRSLVRAVSAILERMEVRL